LKEQAEALERVTTRKLSALVGRAGTGKSSVVGALMRCKKLNAEGILLLAPTGKARVRLGKATSAEAMTVAQFLYGLDRYDPVRQRPLFTGQLHRKEKTVVDGLMRHSWGSMGHSWGSAVSGYAHHLLGCGVALLAIASRWRCFLNRLG
jgi:ATP-dependent exoDNAse (exonuclease V) alpha subunit